MNKRVRNFGAIAIIIFFILVLNIGIRVISTYRTEENAGIILKSIVEIKLGKKDEIKLNDSMYLTKVNNNFVESLMESKGWNFEERLGSCYRFKSSEGKYETVTTRLVYSSNYALWVLQK